MWAVTHAQLTELLASQLFPRIGHESKSANGLHIAIADGRPTRVGINMKKLAYKGFRKAAKNLHKICNHFAIDQLFLPTQGTLRDSGEVESSIKGIQSSRPTKLASIACINSHAEINV
jgi:hypothetical protein